MILPLIIICLFAGATIMTHVLVCTGIALARRKERRLNNRELPENETVTIVIPAKDEENTLPELIKHLENQSFQDFSVVFVNDRSADATDVIMEDYRRRIPDRVTILRLTENSGTFNPKQYALSRGIEAARGSILLFTDADCTLPPDWARNMVKPFAEKDTGMVFGAVITKKTGKYLSRFQTFDHCFRYYYTAGVAGLNLPSGGFGNNLAIRKTVLEAIGGYDSIEETATEDAALIAAVRKRTGCRILALTEPGITVRPEPLDTMRNMARQELRWSSGAFFSKDPGARWGYAAVMIFLAGGLFVLPFIPLWPPLLLVSAATFASMLSIALTGAISSRMPFFSYWLLLVPNILFASLLYTFVNILCLFKVPIEWKGKKLEWKK
ncbi:MAG: glycosyltransferase [Spirochaetales bacterium]|nr:MAG: glycosyltransferase [Spirochaetales bacterium]